MLIVHRSETARGLVGGLAEVLADHAADPLTPELVVVPTRGIERWLTQELSLLPAGGRPAPGITANIDFRFPGRFFSDVLTAAAGSDRDVWARHNLLWSVLGVLDSFLDDPTFLPVRAFVSDAPAANRIVAADRIAGLFARYDHEYPVMLRRWREGGDTGPDGQSLGDDHRWQPILWRAIRTQLGVPCLGERLDDLTATLATDRHLVDLPDRISFYGFTAVPEGELAVLRALGSTRDVNLFVLHPSDGAWPKPEPANPLLRSWGSDAQQLSNLIDALGADRVRHHPVPAAAAGTLLGRLHDRIRTDTHDTTPTPLDPTDRSIQVHSCHGLRRQVEVVRDAVLHALADDPSLEPRDVLIMCPDVETFAPLIEAAFHPDETDGVGIPEIRVRIADRAPAAVNPLADLLARLVGFARSRATGSQVIELLDLEPVRRRFWLDQGRVDAVTSLINALGVRWGFDADHRTHHDLPDRPELTWDASLDRLAAGAFLSDRIVGTVGGVMPLEGVDSQSLDAASTVFELLDRLDHAYRLMQTPTDPAGWRQRLGTIADLLGGTDWESAWQRPALARDLERLLSDSPPQSVRTLSVDEVEVVLEDLRRTRATTINHRTGDLTVCTLVPMRSVPHRVICLLGMDDGRFPRNPVRDGDDLLADFDLPGVRNVAREDRQLLLDAVMAAEERLIVTFSGRDERTNTPLPPAVPIAELLEEIDDIATAPDGGRASERITVQHPLQPFNPMNFTPDALVDGVWGFDRHMAAGARALAAPAAVGPESELAPWDPPAVIDLDELKRFLEHPVRAFVVNRMGVRFYEPDPLRDDRLPLALDALGRWNVGEALLTRELTGHDPDQLIEGLIASGGLPVGRFAEAMIDDVRATVDAIVELADAEGVGRAVGEPVTVDVGLSNGIRLVGLVPAVTAVGVEQVTFSRPSGKRLVKLWVDLVAAAAVVERPVRGVFVGRDGQRGTVYRLAAPPDPLAVLAQLTDLYCRGLSEPIPLFCETSYLLGFVQRATASQWTPFGYAGESADPHHVAAFGGELEFDDLYDFPLAPDEQGDDWPVGDCRFEVLARRLWDPVRAALQGEG